MNWIKKYIFTDMQFCKDGIRPIFLLKNTRKLPIGSGKSIYRIIFLSQKNLTLYYYFSCIVDSETRERVDSEFKILTKEDRPKIINEINKFVNCLSDGHINVFTFEKCMMSHESAQNFMEDVLTRDA